MPFVDIQKAQLVITNHKCVYLTQISFTPHGVETHYKTSDNQSAAGFIFQHLSIYIS